METEGGVGVQTPTRGLMAYFWEIQLPIITAARGELKFAGYGGRREGPVQRFTFCYQNYIVAVAMAVWRCVNTGVTRTR